MTQKPLEPSYTEQNARTFDQWIADGWEWGVPIEHSTYERALWGDWSVLLTPTKPVPREWLGELRGKHLLGLASGGGQQMPLFVAAGADCTVLDYSECQLESERLVAEREGYSIEILRADMSRPLPFPDESFDLIFHPVSNCYIEEVEPLWRECFRILRPGGRLLAGLDNGLAYAFDEGGSTLVRRLPFNPLRDPALYEESLRNDWGIQFSHTIEEQIGGQLRAGFRLLDLYGDTDAAGPFADYNIPVYYATLAEKPDHS